MDKLLIIDIKKCTGCELCMDVCSGRKAGVYSKEYSRIRIRRDEPEGIFIPLVCLQCREHPCAEACPEEAILHHSSLGLYAVDQELCTGCGICEQACPYDGIFMGPGYALKCDLCGREPACVGVCFPKALDFREADQKEINSDLKTQVLMIQEARDKEHG